MTPSFEQKFLELAEALRPELGRLEQVDFLARHGVLTHFFLAQDVRKRMFAGGRESEGFQKAREYALRTAGFAFHAGMVLQKLLQEMERRELPVLTFKGAALSQLLYGGLTSRPFGDVDLLVRPQDMSKVQALFQETGWRRGYPADLSDTQSEALLRFSKAMTLHNKDFNCPVDLHWRLLSQWVALEVPFEALWERRQTVEAKGLGLWPTFGQEDQVLFLAMHGAQDGWAKLKNLLDLALYLSRHPVDWGLIQEISGPRFALLGQSVSLCTQLLGVPQPPGMKPFFAGEREAMDFLLKSMRAKDPPHHRLLAPRLWSCSPLEALRRSLSALLTPAVDDICSLNLPSALLCAYPAVRCFRILQKAVQRKRVF